MELYAEILSRQMLKAAADANVELTSFRTLQKIKNIIEDETLDDPQCFRRIEEILCALESVGGRGGTRHDF